MKNVLILGSGGREHAFAWKLAQSSQLSNLYIAPGNAGTALHGKNLNIDIKNFEEIESQIDTLYIDILIIGPEDPLVHGIVDYFRSKPKYDALVIIGPDQKGAQLEGSKDFSKQFMQKYNIPTAQYKTFTISTLEEGYQFLETLKAPYVLKADGLAAGKGVLIINHLEEAKDRLKDMLLGRVVGNSAKKVVIEEFLSGIELSVFMLSDGKNYVLLPEAKDYKRIGEGDTGLNTGGMGAISPVPFADRAFMKKVIEKVIEPTMQGIRNEQMDYKGFVFVGLMNVQGEPYVIEYNCRMGDPETEVVIPRIKNDLIELCLATHAQELDKITIQHDERYACTVMAVSGGYPNEYEKGKEITGLEKVKNSIVFHAGTQQIGNQVVTNGGRVLSVTSYGKNMQEALQHSYESLSLIHFSYEYFRTDIGKDLLKMDNG